MEFPAKNTGVGCHFLLQGIFLIQGLNPSLLCLPHHRWFLYHWATWESILFRTESFISCICLLSNLSSSRQCEFTQWCEETSISMWDGWLISKVLKLHAIYTGTHTSTAVAWIISAIGNKNAISFWTVLLMNCETRQMQSEILNTTSHGSNVCFEITYHVTRRSHFDWSLSIFCF